MLIPPYDVTTGYTTGLSLPSLDDLAADLGAQVASGLKSPKVMTQLEQIAVSTFESPAVKAALRPTLIEAAAWVGGAVLLAVAIGRRI